MHAMPKLHIKYVRHQSSIRLDSYTLDLRLPVSHAKVHKTGNMAFFEQKSEETYRADESEWSATKQR
jgi:hypothetical protein